MANLYCRALGISKWTLFSLVFCVLLLALPEARADHSQGNSCIGCHSLRSGAIEPGSRNVLKTEVSDYLYTLDWYCGSANWAPLDGEPLDCSFCHKSDIAIEFQAAIGGKFNTVNGVGSAHPVDVGGDTFDSKLPNDSPNPNFSSWPRILCNDCHDGAGGELTPLSPCSKNSSDGYPNHNGTVVPNVLAQPWTSLGANNVAYNPPRLTDPYGTDVTWTTTTFAYDDVLCFRCHDQNDSTNPPYSSLDESAMTNIMGDYNASQGGHNVSTTGSGPGGVADKKLACYHCHDPHSAADDAGSAHNEALINNAAAQGMTIPNPYDSNSTFDYYGYDRTETTERAMCLECHDDVAAKVDSSTMVQLENPITSGNLVFGFHADVHATAITSGGCLQSTTGCHFSVHNNSPYECLRCHTESARGKNALLDAVAHVDSEFGNIGNVTGNGILSQHNIPYTPNPSSGVAPDMSVMANNGCLSCHNVAGTVTGKLLAVVGSSFTQPTVADRGQLSEYDAFCEGCHDGSTDTGKVFDGLEPPRVEKYFTLAGHGRTADFDSGNTASEIGCLECHLYHGSTTYKLLPGNTQTTDYSSTPNPDSGGRVIKGFSYSGATETAGTNYTIGGVPDSSHIDYIDYTVEDRTGTTGDNKERKAIKYADYTAPWDTYYDASTSNPAGTLIAFGTSGDRVDVESRVSCTEELDTTAPTEPVGFCDTCHLYEDVTGPDYDGTTTTFNGMRTHAGFVAADMNDCEGNPKYNGVSVNFQKDCTECHDPHGSGAAGSTDSNWYMIRGKIVTSDNGSQIETYNVVLDEPDADGIFMGPDSLDEDDSDNKDDLCAVCHNITGSEGASHNRNDNAGVRHNEGDNCIACHQHTDRFMPSGCNGCHGYPPGEDTGVPDSMPPDENYLGGGLPHKLHVDFLAGALGLNLASFPTKEVCGPCHGDGAGSVNHNTSVNGAGSWPLTARTHVNIEVRAQSSWGASPTYGGLLLPVGDTHTTTIPADAMDDTDSRCGNVDCHGPEDPSVIVSWNLPDSAPDTASVDDGIERSRVCEACHDEEPADIRVYDAAGALQYDSSGYTSQAVNAAANYYAPIAGYGRGGHGDPRIAAAGIVGDEDPPKDSAPGVVTPIDCTACHDSTAAHLPSASNDIYRLGSDVDGGDIQDLCLSCHNAQTDGAGVYDYIKWHHTSYNGYSGEDPPRTIVPEPGSPVLTAVGSSTTWIQDAFGHYDQREYGAGASAGGVTYNKNPDVLIDFWGSEGGTASPGPFDAGQTAEPAPVLYGEGDGSNPRAVLPLEQFITGSLTTTNKVLCTTCHNPHGTSLFAYDENQGPIPGNTQIPDNNMLRMKSTTSDSTLCKACHPED